MCTVFGKYGLKLTGGIKGSGRKMGGGAGLSPRLWLETFAMSWPWCLRTFRPPVCPLQGWNLKGREYKNFREGSRKHLLVQHRQSSLPSSFGSLNRYFPLFSLIPATMEFGAGMQGKWDGIRWDHWVLNSQGSRILGCYFRPALGRGTGRINSCLWGLPAPSISSVTCLPSWSSDFVT